jgi:hypothetical protein
MLVWLQTQTWLGRLTGRGPWYLITPVQDATNSWHMNCTSARSQCARRGCRCARSVPGARMSRADARRGAASGRQGRTANRPCTEKNRMKKMRKPPISTTNLARAGGASAPARPGRPGGAPHRARARAARAPDGEQDQVAHDQADQPEREEVDVPVPGVAASRLEAAQERVVHDRGARVLQQRADVQQVLPARARAAAQRGARGARRRGAGRGSCGGVRTAATPPAGSAGSPRTARTGPARARGVPRQPRAAGRAGGERGAGGRARASSVRSTRRSWPSDTL